MIVNVMSQCAAEKATEDLQCKTAIISITGMYGRKPEFCDSENLVAVLRLQFEDCLENEEYAMTESDAEQVAEFVAEIIGKADRLIVHCGFGSSRSAGVAAAIIDSYGGKADAILNSDRYKPNEHCNELVKRAMADRDIVDKRFEIALGED